MLDLLLLSRNAAVFIAVIVLLRLVFKRYLPRTAFVVLWLAAAVRMLCPFRLPSAMSVWGLLHTPEGAPAAGTAVVRTYRRAVLGGMPVKSALPNVCDFLEGVWLLGVAVLLIGIAVIYLAGSRKARAARQLENGVYLCDGIRSQQLCGIVRPRILVPEGVGEDVLPYVLLHERVHMRRHDNLWKLLALAAAAVHWFNPAAWVLVALLGRDLEVSCDEWVLRGLDDEQRRSYALSLITMAESLYGQSPVACGFSCSPLEERIRNIMKNRKKSAFALSVATAMILCTTSAFATDAPAGAEDKTEYTVKASGENISVTAKDGTDAFIVTTKDDTEDVIVTKKNGEPVETLVALDSVDFFTADEYAAYIEEQKVALLADIEAGILSQETYDMTIRDMEEVLEGIRAGLMMAAKPFENEDGEIVEICVSTPDAAEAEGLDIHYEIEEDGTLSAVIGEQSYSVTTDELPATIAYE